MSNGNYHFKLGALECISMLDSAGLWPGAAPFFVNASADLLEQACHEHGVHVTQLPLVTVCLFVKLGSHRVVLDTGVGANPDPAFGRLHERLQAEQIAPQSIDTVILSHWHFDHVWGSTLEDGRLAFPNARYVMWKADWEWATAEANLPSMQDGGGERSRDNLLAIKDQLLLVDREGEIMPGIQAITAPGHTIGHMGLLISSGSQKLLCVGDIAHHPIHVEHPDWYSVFDFAPEQAIATRRALLGRAADEHLLAFGPHLPPMGVGHVIASREGWHWRPAS